MLLNTPNLITLGRILIIPIMAFFLSLKSQGQSGEVSWIDSHTASSWALLCFTLAGLSDLVDGYIARRTGTVSLMGKFFDPMADKLIHLVAMIFLIDVEVLEPWLASVLLFREIFITGLRSAAAGEGLIIDAGEWGKYKTAWINFGLGALMLVSESHQNIFKEIPFSAYGVGMICLVMALIFSVISGLQYTFIFWKTLKVAINHSASRD